ncbi:putative minor capsid protein [Curtobacterium phage Parvaparticeps]|nr:putative minor capsid protein [Curtobacterium phage Parvaparticeps]
MGESRFEGVGEMVKRIKEGAESMKEGAAEGLFMAAEFVLGEANERVPLETGGLMRSGSTSIDKENMVAAISYDAVQAVPQHENLSYHHDHGRRAKFLESAINDNAKTVAELVRKGAASKIGGM